MLNRRQKKTVFKKYFTILKFSKKLFVRLSEKCCHSCESRIILDRR